MNDDMASGRVKLPPGPPKAEPLIPDLGITRKQLLVKTGERIALSGKRPTLDAVQEAEPLLSRGFINKHGKMLEGARNLWRLKNGIRPSAPVADFACEHTADVVALAEARVARLRKELADEKEDHRRTKDLLIWKEEIIARMLSGPADEMAEPDGS